jgi:hypothetical protein
MTGHLADHLGLGDGGDHPQRPLTAPRTWGHNQGTPPLQEAHPTPARRPWRGIVPLYALLVRRRRERAALAADDFQV